MQKKRSRIEKVLQKISGEEFVQTISIHYAVGFAITLFEYKQVIAELNIFVAASHYTNSRKEKIFKMVRKVAKQIIERL